MSEKLTIDRVLEAAAADKHLGFCTRCGTEAEGVEPDARKYTCSSCGAAAVYGTEELLLNGLFELDVA